MFVCDDMLQDLVPSVTLLVGATCGLPSGVARLIAVMSHDRIDRIREALHAGVATKDDNNVDTKGDIHALPRKVARRYQIITWKRKLVTEWEKADLPMASLYLFNKNHVAFLRDLGQTETKDKSDARIVLAHMQDGNQWTELADVLLARCPKAEIIVMERFAGSLTIGDEFREFVFRVQPLALIVLAPELAPPPGRDHPLAIVQVARLATYWTNKQEGGVSVHGKLRQDNGAGGTAAGSAGWESRVCQWHVTKYSFTLATLAQPSRIRSTENWQRHGRQYRDHEPESKALCSRPRVSGRVRHVHARRHTAGDAETNVGLKQRHRPVLAVALLVPVDPLADASES